MSTRARHEAVQVLQIRGVAHDDIGLDLVLGLLGQRAMKKIPFQKLALTAETIRHLTAAEMRSVGGQGIVSSVITTSHSITSACNTFTVATTPAKPSGEVD